MGHPPLDTYVGVGQYHYPDGTTHDTSKALITVPIWNPCVTNLPDGTPFCPTGDFPSGSGTNVPPLGIIGFALLFVDSVDNGEGVHAHLIDVMACGPDISDPEMWAPVDPTSNRGSTSNLRVVSPAACKSPDVDGVIPNGRSPVCSIWNSTPVAPAASLTARLSWRSKSPRCAETIERRSTSMEASDGIAFTEIPPRTIPKLKELPEARPGLPAENV